jgi:4-diphosphocytidyl-2-C-methyl-D-erythritol kinase
METERFAPAKVNLFLHVGPLGADGYHPLASLVTFADVGDVVRMQPAPAMEFNVVGPFANALGRDADNLVTRARDQALARLGVTEGLRLTLDKRLPIASGIGGGSTDAAATLRLIAERYAPQWFGGDDGGELVELAGQLGSDVPMCLYPYPMLAEGRGDALDYPPPFPELDAVLVNPMRPSPTGAVYRAYDLAGAPGDAALPPWPEPLETAHDLARFLSRCRNDLQSPAISLQPAIAEALAALKARPETIFARMSGSGATCFALCACERDRRDLAFSLSAAHPDWWVRDCRLAGFCPEPSPRRAAATSARAVR